MKLVLKGVNSIVKLKKGILNSIVIENPLLLYDLIRDIKLQLNKQEGHTVYSINNEPVEIWKSVELITDVYGLDLNSKTLLNKIVEEMNRRALDPSNYEKTMQLIGNIQCYVDDLIWDMDCDLSYYEIYPKQLFKTIDLYVVDDDSDLSSLIYKYLELVRQYIGDKLFIFVNFRGFVDQEKFTYLVETLIEHDFNILFIDNKSYPLVKNENRLTVDIDLCEF